jgi:hypothetical protein
MNSQACLLCGKTLSRIRVGSGEDFCCRDHRDQYRLRRGMDRLGQGKKPSGVIPPGDLFKPLTAAAASIPAEPRIHDARMSTRLQHPGPQPIPSRIVTRIPAAGILRELLPHAPRQAQAREFQILRLAKPNRLTLRIAARESIKPRRVKYATLSGFTAKKGVTPRVSLHVKFRLPRVEVWRYGGTSVAAPHLVWQEAPIHPTPRNLAPSPRTLSVGREFPEAHARTVHLEIRRAQTTPTFVPLAHRPADWAAAHRIAAAPFVPQDPAVPPTAEE